MHWLPQVSTAEIRSGCRPACSILTRLVWNCVDPSARQSYDRSAVAAGDQRRPAARGPAGPPERARPDVGPGRANAGLHNDQFVVILTRYQIPPLGCWAVEGVR